MQRVGLTFALVAATLMLAMPAGAAIVDDLESPIGGPLSGVTGWTEACAAWGDCLKQWTLHTSGQPCHDPPPVTDQGMRCQRTSSGVSAGAKTYTIDGAADIWVANYMALLDAKWSGSGRWCEFAYRLGTYSVGDCEDGSGFTTVKKFTEADTAPIGWTRTQSPTVPAGGQTSITLCIKDGTGSGDECYCQVDEFEITQIVSVNDWSLY